MLHTTLGRILFDVLLCACLVSAQDTTPKKDNPERQHALELYDEGKMVDAMPLFEKLAADDSKDLVVMERWGMTTMAYAGTLADPELRKKARIRARTILLKAKELGDNSNLLQVLLAGIPEDGEESKFSSREDVDKVMQQAEADFARGEYDKARAGYLQATLMDPKLYEAPLFIGDAFYKQQKPGSAGEWYARAIEVDPNRETAYRYWGDALVVLGQMDEARSKFIEAVIAEPYGRKSWMGVSQWADKSGVKLNFVRLQQHGAAESKDGRINITIDSSLPKDDPSGGGWLAYNMERALWQGEKFKKEFPSEPKYRHSMREEADALHLLVSVIAEQGKPKKKGPDLDPALAMLVKIDQAGLLEPFALLNRADEGIAQDYESYRAANRDKIRRYLDEIVVPKTPQKSAN